MPDTAASFPSIKQNSYVQLVQWMADPVSFLQKHRKVLGKSFWLHIGSLDPFLVTCEEKLVQKIMQGRVDSAEDTIVFAPLLGEDSIIVQSGSTHRDLRSSLMPFFQGEQLNRWSNRVTSICEQFVASWNGKHVELRPELEALTLKIIIEFVFGAIEPTCQNELVNESRKFLGLFRSKVGLIPLFMPSLYFGIGSFGSKPFIEKRKAALDAVVMKTVATSLPCLNKDNATIISALVPEGVSISELDREQQDWICDQVRTLLFAGYETTSSALTWALYHLALAPDYLEELQTTATLNGSSPSPLLRCICDESLRRYPISPVMFIRKLETPLETEGGILPKGSLVAPSIVLSHLEQGIWGNDANDWLPHRFQNLKASPFQYYPFGGGLRRCLGASLAILEMQCLIQQVALTSRIKVVSTKIPKLARRGLTLQASCPIVISFESRHN